MIAQGLHLPSVTPATSADIADLARRILQAHIRMIDGRCRGCYVECGHWVRHPCGTAVWAAEVEGHDMTVRFLTREC